tara:strand:- start:2528 stop:2965 length:438 start_codon:yes stop_codon:yes gene_type:complete
MPANTSPIYSIVGAVDSVASNETGLVVGPTANTSQTGSGTLYKAFTAGANGSYVQKMRFRPVGSPAATVCRVFISSSSTTSTTATWLYDEITLPAVTVSQTAASSVFELPLNFALDPNYLLYVTFGTSTGSAGTGYSVVTIAGDY